MTALLLCERTTVWLNRIKINKTFGNAWRHEHLANGSNATFKSKTIRQSAIEKLLEHSTVAVAGLFAGGMIIGVVCWYRQTGTRYQNRERERTGRL